MKRVLVLAFLCLGVTAHAQPVVVGWRPPVGCSTGQLIAWNGTAWTCGSAGVTGSGTSGRSTRWTSTSAIGTGAFTDNGTNINTAADDSYLAWDIGTARIGFMKKSGFIGKLAYGSAANFAIAQSDGTSIAAAGTFTDRLVLDTSGNLIAYQNAIVGDAAGEVFSVVTASSNATNVVGFSLFPHTDGNTYQDTKTSSAGGFAHFRIGKGAESGGARYWMSVDGSNGAVTHQGNVNLGDGTTDTTTIAGLTTIYAGLSGAANVDVLKIGNSTSSTTSADIGITTGLDRSAGYVYQDTKLGASGALVYRIGSGTNPGYTNAWLNVAGTGNAIFQKNLDVSQQLYVAGATIVDGNATIGNANSDSHTINGSVTQNDDGTALFITSSPAAATAQAIASSNIMQGTYNTTGGAITAIGVYGAISSARSSGANNLTNVGILAQASGGQINRALQTNDGDVLLNATSGTTAINGNTTLGDSTSADSHTVNGRITHSVAGFADSFSTTLTSTAATYTVQGATFSSSGTFDATAASRTNVALRGIANASRSAGSNTVFNVALFGTAANGQTNIALQTDDGNVILNNTSGTTSVLGNATIGDANSDAHAFNGGITHADDGIAYALTSTPSAATSSMTTFDLIRNGTFNTTSGALTSGGLSSSVTSTRSSGANNLTNRAAYLNAQNGQVNYSLYTDNGDTILNATSGNTCIGGTGCAGGSNKLEVTGAAKITGSTEIANSLFVSAGTLTIDATGAGTARFAMSNSETGVVSQNFASIAWDGSIDGTAAGATATGLRVTVNGSQSAGANNVRQYAISANASPNTGMDENYAFRSENGDNYFNEFSGLTIFGGKVQAIGTDPTISTCGTSPTVTGSDHAGVVTVGTGTATACTVTFSTTMTTEPACTVTSNSNNANPLYFSAKSATAFTVSTSAGTNLAGQKFNYVCFKM